MTDTPEVGPPPIDHRPRQLLEKYASLIGSMLLDTDEGVAAFEVPASEWRHWGGEHRVIVAFTPEALENDPEAQLLTIGSQVHERLLSAIRGRGFRNDFGLVPALSDPIGSAPGTPIPIENAEVGAATSELSLLPIGRLLVRVSIRGGPALEERLIESPLLDLSSGARMAAAVEAALPSIRESEGIPPGTNSVSMRPMEELVPLLFESLEKSLQSELTKVSADAVRNLGEEVARLERYYAAMARETEGEGGGDPTHRKQMIAAELGRRRTEAEERFRTRIVVHPVQLQEWQILAQRTSWPLTTSSRREASLTATRYLSGDTAWSMVCSSCGGHPTSLRVCKHGHVACPNCSDMCTLCSEFACRQHGLAKCDVGSHPVCGTHRLTCDVCRRAHCEIHSTRCVFADHLVCPGCAVACARCAMVLCRSHALQTTASAPNGQRWLCESCVVYCEGGANEPVGLDEVERCTGCERYVCRTHRVMCAVDGQVLCSKHLRRSDRSGRLICERHQASCEEEPESILASDEIQRCGTCQKQICQGHGEECAEDRMRHCHSHLSPLADAPGLKGCERHASVCHVDGVAYSLAGTRVCPVCNRPTCAMHRLSCPSCARQICIRDVEEDICRTCARLIPVADLEEDLILAAVAANGGEPAKAKEWRVAQDAGGKVVQLDLGWTRRLTFTVQHGDAQPQTVVRQSLMGRKRIR